VNSPPIGTFVLGHARYLSMAAGTSTLRQCNAMPALTEALRSAIPDQLALVCRDRRAR
jgi:hypothetical protein